jgi:hypothetical protein
MPEPIDLRPVVTATIEADKIKVNLPTIEQLNVGSPVTIHHFFTYRKVQLFHPVPYPDIVILVQSLGSEQSFSQPVADDALGIFHPPLTVLSRLFVSLWEGSNPTLLCFVGDEIPFQIILR